MLSLKAAKESLAHPEASNKRYPHLVLLNREVKGNQRVYPEIALSHSLLNLLTCEPSLPKEPVPPKVPIEPIKPTTDEVDTRMAISLGVSVLSAIIILCLLFGELDGKGFYIGFLAIVLLLSITNYSTSNKERDNILKARYIFTYRQEEYKKEKQEYEQEYHKYLQLKQDHENTVKELLSEQKLAQFRATEVASWIIHRKKPTFGPCLHDIPKKGISENLFEERLRASFNNVLTNQRIETSSFDTFYYPDFLIIKDNLFIDIEIDEPYTGDTKEPIHYLDKDNLSVDEDRDNWLISNGFEIIRFSEEQVLLHPNECISFIDSLVKNIKNGEGCPKTPSGIVVKRWTKDEATEYAKRDFRLSYTSQPPCDDFPGFKD